MDGLAIGARAQPGAIDMVAHLIRSGLWGPGDEGVVYLPVFLGGESGIR